jgi:hypothetical protein
MVKAAGIRLDPRLVLSASRAATLLLSFLSVLLLFLYSSSFSFFHPFIVLPTAYFLCCFLLESFEVFSFSPVPLALGAYVSWKRMQVESELPYAMLFLNQVLSLGVPVESALCELGRQESLQAVFRELEHPVLLSRPVQEFRGFLSQCRRAGVTPQVLEDLFVMSSAHRERALSGFRSLNAMAGNIFTYVLALYTCSILVIIVAAVNEGSTGLEFLLLVVVNPLLFAAGFIHLMRGRSG